MSKVTSLMKKLRRDEDGAALIEYTVLLGILIVAVIATITLVGTWVSGQWTTLRPLCRLEVSSFLFCLISCGHPRAFYGARVKQINDVVTVPQFFRPDRNGWRSMRVSHA